MEQDLRVEATVGVGIPGTLSSISGLVKNANSTWLIGHPLDRDLARALKRTVRLMNDANCFVRNQHGDSSGVRGAAWLWPSPANEGTTD